MRYAKHIGRVGALAVALGVGTAVASGPVAWAAPAEGGTSSSGGGTSAGEGAGANGSTGAATEGTASTPGATAGESGSGAGAVTGGSSTDSNVGTGSATGGVPGVATGATSPSETSTDLGNGVVVSSSGGSQPAAKKTKKAKKTGEHGATSTSRATTSASTSISAPAASSTSTATSGAATGTTAAPASNPPASPAPAAAATAVSNAPVAALAAGPTPAAAAPATSAVSAVLSALAAPLSALGGGPESPVVSPAIWVLAAAARRQLGQDTETPTAAVTLAAPIATSQPLVTAKAAAAPNLPPVITDVIVTNVDQGTGEVDGRVIAVDPDPNPKPLKFSVTNVTGDGTVFYDTKTGDFTYAPTQDERVYAAAQGGYTVDFDVTVSDGVKANNVTQTVTIDVPPVAPHDIGSVPTGSGPFGIAVTNDRAYVGNFNDGTITIINTRTGATVGAPIAVGAGPTSIALTPDGTKLYVVNSGLNNSAGAPDPTAVSTVSVINTATGTLIGAPITIGHGGFGIAMSPDGKTVYVTNALDGTISRIATATNKVTTSKVGGYPTTIIVSPDGKKVYVSSLNTTTGAGTVTVYSSTITGAKVIDTSATPSYGIAVSPDKSIVAISHADGSVTVYDTAKNTQLANFSVGNGATDVAFTSDGTVLAVATTDGTVSFHEVYYDYDPVGTVVFDASYTPSIPSQLALSPDGVQLYVTDASSGTLHTISLVPDNAAPVAGNPTLNPPNASGVVTGDAGITDPDGDRLAYTTTGAPAKGTLVLNDDGTFTYTPTAAARHAASAVGATAAQKTDTFTITAADTRRGVVTQTVTVTILGADQAPVTKASAGTPNSTTGVVKGSVTGTDKDKDPLTYSTDPVSAKGGAVTIDAKGAFVYTPTAAARHAAAAVGATAADKIDTFTVTVDDGHGQAVTQLVTVKIAPANAKPTGATTSFGTPDNATGAVVGTVHATDTDLDDFTVTGPASTKKGTITYDSATDSFTYTPTVAARNAASAPNSTAATRSDSFTVTVSDGHGGTTTAAVTVTIAVADNHAPTGGAFTAGTPNGSTGAVSGTVTATDPDGNPLSYSGTQTTAKGKVTVNTNGTFTYTPTAAARHDASTVGAPATVTTDTFTVTADDGRGGTLAVPVSITISPKNAAPTGNYTAGQPNANTGIVTGTVTGTDPDGDAVNYGAAATSAKGGTVSVNASTGAFTYTPSLQAQQAAGATGAPASARTDTFAVTVSDGHTGTATVNVNVTVAPATVTPVQGVDGIPIGNVVGGSTGNLYQVLTHVANASTNPTFTSTVRVYSPSGAVIGDSSAFSGVPVAAPVVRTDGGVAVVSYDQTAQQTTVTIVGTNAATTSTTFRGAPGGTAGALLGTDTVKYVLTSYYDQTPHVTVVPLSAGSAVGIDVQGPPIIGADGSLYAPLVAGTPTAPQNTILRIKPNGTVDHLTAAQFNDQNTFTSAVSGGPDGKAYVTTVVANPQTGNSTTEVLVFSSSSTTATSIIEVPGFAKGGVLIAANGTTYQLSQDGYSGADVTINRLSGGVVSSAAIPVGTFGADVVGVSSTGTVYLTSPDSDNDVTKLIIGRPDGTTSVVQLGGFEFTPHVGIGTDGNAYWSGEDQDGNPVFAVITPGGVKRVLAGGGIFTFGSDGKAYLAVDHADGVVVLSSTDGFATFTTSDTVAGHPDPFGGSVFQAGPNGIVYVQTTGSAALVNAVDTHGHVIATVPSGGTVVGPIVFGPNGTGYVTVQTGSAGSAQPAKTAVWALSVSGATKLAEFDGQPASTGLSATTSSTPAVVIGSNGKLYLTTVVIDTTNQTFTTYVNTVSTTSVL